MTDDQPADHRSRVGAERRQRMLDHLAEAALAVVAERGIEGAGVDAIIQAADVSRGTFYKYYDAPSELIRAVGAALAQDLILAMGPTLERLEDPPARLAVGFRLILKVAGSNRLLAGFLIRAGWPVTDHVPAFSQRVTANLAAGIAQGRFRTPSLAVAEALVGGLVIGSLAAEAKGAADGMAEEATVVLLRGLGLPEAEARNLATLPLDPPALPPGGLLARTLGGAGGPAGQG